MAYLNQILVNDKILPNELLEQLRIRIKDSLKQHNINQNNDSIDMFCCRICTDENTLLYAAANIPGYLLNDEKIIELPAQKTTLGFNLRTVNFENVTIPIKSGDRLLVFSDGIPDQFNQLGERFSRRHLLHLFEMQKNEDFSGLKKNISDAFFSWKADTSQTDDALLVGVEF
jgi:serine phosphatase RsbU (regulator of sigma subunit)